MKCKYLKDNVGAEPWARGAVFPRDFLLHLPYPRAESIQSLAHPDPLPFPGEGSSRGSFCGGSRPQGFWAAVPHPRCVSPCFGVSSAAPRGCTGPSSAEPCPALQPRRPRPGPQHCPKALQNSASALLLCRACLSEEAETAWQMGFPQTLSLHGCVFSVAAPWRGHPRAASPESAISVRHGHTQLHSQEQGSPGDHWGLV